MAMDGWHQFRLKAFNRTTHSDSLPESHPSGCRVRRIAGSSRLVCATQQENLVIKKSKVKTSKQKIPFHASKYKDVGKLTGRSYVEVEE